MSHISETVDLEAEIEALIKRAGDSLRQPADARPHAHDAEHSAQIASPAATNVMCAPQGREQSGA
jgi:hypothetical protein